MKLIKQLFIGLALVGSLTACHDLLEETPKDFLTPENSFVDKAGFESALADIYLKIRTDFYLYSDGWDRYDLMGGDVDLASLTLSDGEYREYFQWNTMNKDSGFSKKWWSSFYSYIFSCNVIIDRAENPNVRWKDEQEKNAIVGEAKFLRAYAYHFLANMWGNVPIVLNETTSPRFDYKNSPQEDVYKQCKEDLLFAVQWMPDIDDQKGGKASNVAAYHLLSEVLICLKEYEQAVYYATKAIEHPSMKLMTERFGRYKDFEFEGYDYLGEKEPWGDVYWDLFQDGNFNRINGNMETIWNIQVKYNAVGGTDDSGNGINFERWWGGGDWWRQKDVDGVVNWLKNILGGRSVGSGGCCVTDYAADQIWNYKGDFDRDMRNSIYNIQRVYYWTNPESRFYGMPMKPEDLGDKTQTFAITRPRYMKAIATEHYGRQKESGSNEIHDGGRIYKCWYIMRLAETYLLRAEAYHLWGKNSEAAADINALRNRAHATSVTAADVNLDLILDERARELYMEEYRISTLMRMNKLTEYLMKYNPQVIKEGYQLDDHLNKLPIPSSEIEANKEGGLVQNPGY